MHVSYSEWMPSPREVVDQSVIFAVGDVHGQVNELEALHCVIQREVAAAPRMQHHVIHLGDYIDRGPDSRKVLALLHQGIEAPAEQVNLIGNHDQFLIELLNLDSSLDRHFIINWYENGGMATMVDLDIPEWGRLADKGDIATLSRLTSEALGPELCDFLGTLKLTHRIGNYVFVHAGIEPEKPLEDQEVCDLLLIREPFLSAGESWRHDFCVVHGHSIAAPAIHSHRIGADAGCYRTGAMCALQLTAHKARFIAVTQDSDTPWLDELGPPAMNWKWSVPVLV